MCYKNNEPTVRMGNAKNKTNTNASRHKSGIKIIKSAMIKNDLTTIPIARENPTNPCLYSFFKGLKKVFIKSVRAKASRKALFSDAKNPKISVGASKYQNFNTASGKNK